MFCTNLADKIVHRNKVKFSNKNKKIYKVEIDVKKMSPFLIKLIENVTLGGRKKIIANRDYYHNLANFNLMEKYRHKDVFSSSIYETFIFEKNLKDFYKKFFNKEFSILNRKTFEPFFIRTDYNKMTVSFYTDSKDKLVNFVNYFHDKVNIKNIYLPPIESVEKYLEENINFMIVLAKRKPKFEYKITFNSYKEEEIEKIYKELINIVEHFEKHSFFIRKNNFSVSLYLKDKQYLLNILLHIQFDVERKIRKIVYIGVA